MRNFSAMESIVRTPVQDRVVHRSPADRFMRRVLLLPVDGPSTSIFGSESVFGKSIAVSAVRCLVTYIALPLLAPIVDLTGGVTRPVVGLVLSLVSMTAIFISMRRFFGSDHKYRWGYAVIGISIFCFMIFSAAVDISTLFSN